MSLGRCRPVYCSRLSRAHMLGFLLLVPFHLGKKYGFQKLSLDLHSNTQDLPFTDDELLPPESTNLLQSLDTLFLA